MGTTGRRWLPQRDVDYFREMSYRHMEISDVSQLEEVNHHKNKSVTIGECTSCHSEVLFTTARYLSFSHQRKVGYRLRRRSWSSLWEDEIIITTGRDESPQELRRLVTQRLIWSPQSWKVQILIYTVNGRKFELMMTARRIDAQGDTDNIREKLSNVDHHKEKSTSGRELQSITGFLKQGSQV